MLPMMMIVSAPSPSAPTTGIDSGISASNAAGQKRRQQWHGGVAPLGSRVPRTLRRILARTRQCARGRNPKSAFFNQSGDDSSKRYFLKASERSICKRNQAPASPSRFDKLGNRTLTWASASIQFAGAGRAISICRSARERANGGKSLRQRIPASPHGPETNPP
jgi:hypothetical protein